MAKKTGDVSIGKFDILATYTYAKGLLDGLDDKEARERGMVAAVMGAKAKLGRPGGTAKDYHDDKSAAEKKKKSTITAASFDRQVADKMGPYFEETFLPALKKLAVAGLSYDEVKRLIQIPRLWGAKISGETFKERAAAPR
ncbi:hypothetical protein [Planctomyces sp. SH-PL62]|uniref:hypothetical protein n=1 Tax=Planctomyces sp. SH-PL62 TaxID=1636152 RepID=UPI00078BF168|nr:hypothetical protein [Planctomyces sp. SH-PL62]AMV38418.1 hypothetical protein VT85_13355 [Planctomyces sp. SH-PL62]